jgi:hypothetical protein
MLSAPVLIFVEAERHFRSTDENGPLDQVGLRHHQVDGFLLRPRQWPLFEDRASRAHEVEKAFLVDVFLEKDPIGRVAVDVPLLDVNLLLLQKTSGVAAGGSCGLQVEERLWHDRIVRGAARARPAPRPRSTIE